MSFSGGKNNYPASFQCHTAKMMHSHHSNKKDNSELSFYRSIFFHFNFSFFCLPSTRLPSSWAYSPCPHLSESKLFVSIDKRIFLKFSKIVVFVETQNKSLTCGQKKFCRAVMVMELVLLWQLYQKSLQRLVSHSCVVLHTLESHQMNVSYMS